MIYGVIGLLLLLFAFIMNLLNKWDSNNDYYLFLNCVGCGYMLLYDYLNGFSLFAPLQIIWGITSLIKLVIK